jgi:hypothetical protein
MKNLPYLVITIAVIVTIFSLMDDDDDAYQEKIRETIGERHRYLKFNEGSPFVQFDVTYQDPSYYEIDSEYRVNAKVERIENRELVVIPTSDGTREQYQKYAWLSFSLKGKDMRLLVLKPYGFGALQNLFCGFADETSGVSTYGGGRYLDVEIGKSDKVVIDFNLAYNPYCAYVDEFICPLPPTENILPIAIEAGEKEFKRDI